MSLNVSQTVYSALLGFIETHDYVLSLYLEGIRRPAGLGDDVADRHEPRQHQRAIDERRHRDHLSRQRQKRW